MKLKQLKPNRLAVIKPAGAHLARSPSPQAHGAESWGQGRGGRPWRRLKQLIHERDMWTCCACHQVTTELELDHIINVAIGGTDDDTNLQSLCVPCHKKKTLLESQAGQR